MPRKVLTFEQALLDLQEIVQTIGNGETELEKCVTLYKRGIELAVHCGKKLNKAQEQVMILKKQADSFLETPFDEVEE